MVVTGSVSPTCCCTVFSLQKPSARLQAVLPRSLTPPRTPGNGPCGWLVAKPSPAGDPENRNTNPMLASGNAQHHDAPWECTRPPTDPGSGSEKTHALARASRKVCPPRLLENVSDLWLYFIQISGQPPPFGIFRSFSEWTQSLSEAEAETPEARVGPACAHLLAPSPHSHERVIGELLCNGGRHCGLPSTVLLLQRKHITLLQKLLKIFISKHLLLSSKHLLTEEAK